MRPFAWLPHLHTTLLTIASGCVIGSISVVLWVMVFQHTNPIYANNLMEIDPPDRLLDRDKVPVFRVKRRICSRRFQQVQIIRNWTEHLPGDETRVVVVTGAHFRDLHEGCQESNDTMRIPETLRPGQYVYEASMRACNILNQCVLHRLTYVPVAVLGGSWGRPEVAHPPPLSSQDVITSPPAALVPVPPIPDPPPPSIFGR